MKALIQIIAAVTMLASCSPVLYAPNSQSIPNFRKKGDILFEGSFMEIPDASGFSVAAAVAAGEKNGLGVAFNRLADDYSDADGRGTYFEGYYIRFGVPQKKISWAVNTGLGYGKVKWANSINDYVNAKYMKPFVQPSVSFLSDYFEASISLRAAFVSFIDDDYLFEDAGHNAAVRRFFREKPNTFLFEPGFTIRGGYRNVKIQFQYVITTFTYDDDYQPYNNQNFSVGLNFLLTKWLD